MGLVGGPMSEGRADEGILAYSCRKGELAVMLPYDRHRLQCLP